ncbi:MAG: putative phosphoglycerate mutase [bacterium]|jgi:probable phosphoglycerate mutase
MKSTKLIFVRHGETLWNEEERIQGHADSDLNEVGLAQAVKIGNRFKDEDFDVIFSSDLKRAQMTAKQITQHTKHKLQLEPRFRERHHGVFQGLTKTEILEKYSTEYEKYLSDDPNYIIPNGESITQKTERIISAVNEITKQYEGKKIVIVTHGGVLDSIFRHAFQMSLASIRQFSIFNASINSFEISNQFWKLLSWGDITHLEGLPVKDGTKLVV